jgi:tetratricopeptide (TPR) repeat protein
MWNRRHWVWDITAANVSVMLTVHDRKSQIAVEFAYRFRDRHPEAHVLWVYAANETRFIQAYRETAQKLQLPGREDPQVDVCKLVCEWLNETENVPWLMILDNADRTANFLPMEDETMVQRSAVSTYMAGYLPTRFNHSQFLLITTRRRDIGEYLSHGRPCIDVGPLLAQEAGDLLRTKVRVVDSSNMPEVDNLVEILGRIPLAITQAAAFINRNKTSVQEYAGELAMDKQNFMEYLSSDLQDPRREPGFPNSVFRTWKLSFDQILTDSPRAAEILSLMAWLDGQKIPEDLIRKDDERRIDFRNAIGTLDGYSMINKEVGGETCAIHPLVQLSVQYVLGQSGKSALYAGQALQLIAHTFPNGDHENKAVCESLLPHAQVVLQYSLESDATASPRASLLNNIGWFEWQQGRYESAYQNVQAAYQIKQKIFGDEAHDTVNSLSLLATVLSYQGKYEAAEEMHRRALAGREKVLGVKHPGTLNSLNNLASVLQSQGQYEAAEEMYRRALAGREKVLGVEHPDTLTSLNNLALVLQSQGQYEAAEEMHRRALAGREKVLGVEHPDALNSLNNLASVLQDQGQYEAAEEMHRRALAGREKVLGVEHPETLTSLNNLASVLQGQGQYEAAEEVYRRALAGREKVLGVEHPETLTNLNNLASVLQGQGQYEAAEEVYRRALAGREKLLGVEHPDTLNSVYCLAHLHHSRQQFQQADIIYQRALSGFRQTLGSTHPTTLGCEGNYSSMVQEMENQR